MGSKIMDLKSKLFLDGCLNVMNKNELSVSVETYITLFVLSSCEHYDLNLCFVDRGIPYPCSLPQTAVKCICEFIKGTSDAVQAIGCSLPAVKSADTYFSGLCAVLRWALISQITNSLDHPCKNLLGFRGNCLVACSESSVWTKFCEVEMPQAVREMTETVNSCQDCLTIPPDLMKLEMHLSKPVRTHNILKRKQDIAKSLKKSFNQGNQSSETDAILQRKEQEQNNYSNIDFVISNGDHKAINADAEDIAEVLRRVKITEASDNFHLEHCYVEGIDLTLADFILLPCVHHLLCQMKPFSPTYLPHVMRWYNKMFDNTSIQKGVTACGWYKWNTDPALPLEGKISIVIPVVEPISLYSRDPCRPKLRCRNFDPSSVLSCLENCEIHPKYDQELYENFVGLKWNEIPSVLHPSSGDLPKNRVQRKCQQLESIIWAVLKIAKPYQTIVDFCAGGGHVGLLLAYYLKDCQIILIENKEASMRRAINRTEALNLTNVKFFQCNLDYFKGNFDIGVSLHACGVATDLVIQRCLHKKAGFVCCPCCYGSIQETHLLKYPLSKKFQSTSISYEDFRYLAHCADRTEVNTPKAKQGKLCMGLIDTDRKMCAEESEYKVWLSTLQPESCSPKHNILVGIPHTWSDS